MNPERTTVMRIMSFFIRLTDFAITVCIRRFECPARVTSIMTAGGAPVLSLGRQIVLIAAIGYLFAAGQAQANGTDPTVVAGQASFSTQGSTLSITNSPGAIIHWQGFSIDANEITRFIQQSAASSVLNRVIGSDPSVILGTLTSNGRVFLINPSGILVGQGASIDVAGLVASTLNLSNQDFLAGRLNFEPNPLAGKVENHGRITTPSGGSVYLAGSEVDNSGIINSPQGDVILAAGRSVKIFDSSTPGVRVEITADDNAAVNLGEILAQSGEVGIYGALLRNEGIVDADQVVRDESGKIVLRAKQDVTLEGGSRLSANGAQAGEITVQSETGATRVSGTIEAKGTGEAAGTGGTIKLLGDKVGLFDGNIDASGDAGGGTVLVGGDYQGKDPSIQNASATYMSADSTIAADAIMNGNGGKVVLWADDSTRAYGSISARGGAQGGDGGLLETSGHWLDVDGINIDASAPHGKSGIWLLDPNDITIQLAGSNTNVTASPNFTSTDDDAIVTTASIQTALNVGTDVIITTGSGGANEQAGDITVADTLTWTHVDGPILTLDAHRDVVVNADVTATTGSFRANAGRDVNLNTPVSVTTGNITAIADGNVNVNAALTVTTGDIVLLADNDGTGPGAVIGGTANITCGSNCITITTGELSIRFNPADYSTTGAEITAYGSHLTGGGTLDAKAWVFAQGDDKTYDGTRDAVVNKLKPDVATALPPVTLTTVNALFNTKDVGTDKLITFDSYTLTGSADYDLFTPLGTPDGSGTTTADITAKALTAVALTGTVTKVYDGDATVDNLTTGNYSITGFIAGEGATIGVETGTYDAGKDVVDNPAGSAVSSALLAAGDYTATGTTLLSNYDLSAVTGVSATGAIGEITPKALTAVDLTGTVTKIYDGDASVDNLTTANYAITGFLAGEGATVSETLGSYDNGKDVIDNPAGSAVSSALLAAGDYTQDAGTLLSNYDFSAVTGVSAAGAIGEITPLALTAVDLTGTVTKIYDGDASVDNLTTANYAITGFLAGEGATVTETLGTYDAGKDVIDNPAGSAVSSAVLAAADYTATGTTLLSNYDLSAVTGVSAAGAIGEITPAPLTATVADQTKIYGTDDPALADIDVTLTGLVLDDSTLTSTATSLTRDAGETVVGSLYDITAGTFTTPSTNYSAPSLVLGSTLDITPAALTATVADQSKIYGADDPALAGIGVTLTGLVNDPAIATWNGAVAVNDSALTTTPTSLTRDAGETVAGSLYAITAGSFTTPSTNYSSPSLALGSTLDITPAALTATVADQTKIYGDDDPALAGIGVTLTGLVNDPAIATWNGAVAVNDSALASTATSLTRDAGETVAGSLYDITAGTFTTPSTNYSSPSLVLGSTLDITPKTVNLAATRNYDGTTDFAEGTFTPTITGTVANTSWIDWNGNITTVLGAQTLSIASSGTGTVPSRNAGPAQTMTTGTIALADGSNGGLATNYTLTGGTHNGTITPKALTAVDLTGAVSKIYDGDATVDNLTTGNYSITGFVAGEGATIGVETGTYVAGKDVIDNPAGSAVTSAVLAAADYTATGTTLLSNYDLTAVMGVSATGAIGEITAADLALSGTRVYDATTVFAGDNLIANGIAGETFTVIGAGNITNLASKHVQTGSTLASVTGLSLGTSGDGGLASNYKPITTTGSSVDVTARPVTLTAPSVTKTYDGLLIYATTAGDLNAITLSGPLAGTDTVSAATITYTDKNAGTNNKTVNLNAATIDDGNSGANYTVTLAGNTTSTITALGITGSITAADKVYDGNNLATITGRSLTGALGTDDVTYTGGTATFSDKNAAVDKTVTGTGLSLTGADAGNYTVNGTALTTADITPAPLGIAANSISKTYGSTVSFTGSEFSSTGLKNGETVGSVNLASAGTAPTAGVAGSPYDITASSATGGTFNAANYTISYVDGILGVTPVPLIVTADAQSKVYGTSDPALTFGATGLVNNPALGVVDTVGNVFSGALTRTGGETVLGGPYAITRGTLAPNSNYTLASFTGSNLTITPAVLNVAANPQSKVYGTSDPALTYSVAGLVNNPALGVADTADSVLSGALTRATGDPDHCICIACLNGETVTGGPYAIAQGTLAANSNYTLGFTGSDLTITPAALDVAANPQSKVFGTSDPALTYSVAGIVNNPALGIADTADSVLSGALTRVPGESALGGPYAITQGTLAAKCNYTLGFTPNDLIIIGAAAEPVLGFNAGQVIFAGVINNEFYYRPGNFWHISLNPNNADPGFDVMRGTNDLNSRLRRSMNPCDSISGGGFCETWSFPQQFEKVDEK